MNIRDKLVIFKCRSFIVIDADGFMYLHDSRKFLMEDSQTELAGSFGEVIKVFPAYSNIQGKRKRVVYNIEPGIYRLDNSKGYIKDIDMLKLSKKLPDKIKNLDKFLQNEDDTFYFDRNDQFAIKIFCENIDIERAKINAKCLKKLYPRSSDTPVVTNNERIHFTVKDIITKI